MPSHTGRLRQLCKEARESQWLTAQQQASPPRTAMARSEEAFLARLDEWGLEDLFPKSRRWAS